jgi:hypothetical protein
MGRAVTDTDRRKLVELASPRPPFCVPPIHAELERSAFSLLAADMVRINHACGLLALLPDAAEDGRDDVCHALIAFFTRDWCCHQDDIDDRLANRLRAKLLVGDRTDEVLDELTRQHRDDRARFTPLHDGMCDLIDGQPIDTDLFASKRDCFIEMQRRQATLKRLMVLPVARERLTAEDQNALHRDMMSARKNPAPHTMAVI